MNDIVKVLCVGDPHFKTKNIRESDEMTRKLVKLTKNLMPDFVVLLGDILHTHEKIHVGPLMRAETLIRSLKDIVPTYILIGNHDRPNNSTYMTQDHAFNAMKLWENTYIIDDKVMDISCKNKRFLFVPYVYPGEFSSTLNHNEKGVANPYDENVAAIFCHQEFRNAKMGMIKSRVGDEWKLNWPLIISGHVHDYDRLQENLIYVGTPMQHAFGDRDDKTVSLFIFSGNEKFNFTENRIDLQLKKRIIVYISPDKLESYIPPNDKLVKLVIKGDGPSIIAIQKSAKIKELRNIGVIVVFKTTDDKNIPTSNKLNIKMKYKDRLIKETETNADANKLLLKIIQGL